MYSMSAALRQRVFFLRFTPLHCSAPFSAMTFGRTRRSLSSGWGTPVRARFFSLTPLRGVEVAERGVEEAERGVELGLNCES